MVPFHNLLLASLFSSLSARDCVGNCADGDYCNVCVYCTNALVITSHSPIQACILGSIEFGMTSNRKNISDAYACRIDQCCSTNLHTSQLCRYPHMYAVSVHWQQHGASNFSARQRITALYKLIRRSIASLIERSCTVTAP